MSIKDILARYQIDAKKNLGQHFLHHEPTITAFIQACAITPDDTVIEIGPGPGVLTQLLVQYAKKVIAIDQDERMINLLAKELVPKYPNLALIRGDILSQNIATLLETRTDHTYTLVGAIPYNISSPILHHFIHHHPRPSHMTFLIQKEVAEKVAATPPHASYLSNFIGAFGTATISKNNIAPGVFSPPPKVKSAILHIELFELPLIDNSQTFSDFLHTGFTFPRKILSNTFPVSLLHKANIEPTLRPQALTIAQWINLYNKFHAS